MPPPYPVEFEAEHPRNLDPNTEAELLWTERHPPWTDVLAAKVTSWNVGSAVVKGGPGMGECRSTW